MLGRASWPSSSVDAIGARKVISHREGRERLAAAQRPFLSANDRSRWCTVRVAGRARHVLRHRQGHQQRGWDTIDMVKHRPDGQHLYSSKPPLLPTLMAGEYWLIHQHDRRDAGRPSLRDRPLHADLDQRRCRWWSTSVLLAWLVERFGTTDWGRMFVMAAADVRHVPDHVRRGAQQPHAGGACASRSCCMPPCGSGSTASGGCAYFVVAGLFAAFGRGQRVAGAVAVRAAGRGAAVESPAADAAGLSCPPRCSWPSAAFGTNWIAHDSLRPPYMHRSATDPADNGTTTPTSATASVPRATGAIRWASTAASRRRPPMPCTPWWAITASSRSRRSGC